MDKAELISQESECDDCFYNQGGCRCEEMTAASCIPTPLTLEEKEQRHKEQKESYIKFFSDELRADRVFRKEIHLIIHQINKEPKCPHGAKTKRSCKICRKNDSIAYKKAHPDKVKAQAHRWWIRKKAKLVNQNAIEPKP